VGLGSPDELTASLDDRIVEVNVERGELAIDLLRDWEWVTSATQLGRRVHVLLSARAPASNEAAPAVVDFLAGEGLDGARAHAAEPNLEDVFVALTVGESLAGESRPKEAS